MLAIKKNKIIEFLLNNSAFRITYIISLFLSSVIFIGPVAIGVRNVLMIWAAFIMYFYYIRNKRALKVRYHRWIILFLAANIITCLIHITDNFLPNMQMTFHIAICMFIFYGMHTENNRKRFHLEMYWVCRLIVIITMTLAAVGILLAVLNIRGEYSFYLIGENNYKLIIYENRFTGLYTNPNLLAFSSVVAIVCCHMLSKENFLKHAGKKKQSKALLITSFVLNLISLFLSDSNGSLVLIGFYIAFLAAYRFFKCRPDLKIKDIALRFGKTAVVLLVTAVVLFGSRELTQLAVSSVTGLISSVTSSQIQNQPFSPEDPFAQGEENKITFNHENKNIDSGRGQLLAESAVFITNHPVFGVGKENIVSFSEKYIEGGLHFSDFHNGYLTILVSSGIVGLIIFVAFSQNIFRNILKSLFLEKKDLSYTVFPILFAFLCAYCVFAVLEKTLVYEQTFMVVIFWYILGYAGTFLKKYEHMDEKIDLSSLFSKKEIPAAEIYDMPTDDELSEDSVINEENLNKT
ncbi:MAG: O-antigen ligase family protein [Acutalibacteraceae bacterium]